MSEIKLEEFKNEKLVKEVFDYLDLKNPNILDLENILDFYFLEKGDLFIALNFNEKELIKEMKLYIDDYIKILNYYYNQFPLRYYIYQKYKAFQSKFLNFIYRNNIKNKEFKEWFGKNYLLAKKFDLIKMDYQKIFEKFIDIPGFFNQDILKNLFKYGYFKTDNEFLYFKKDDNFSKDKLISNFKWNYWTKEPIYFDEKRMVLDNNIIIPQVLLFTE